MQYKKKASEILQRWASYSTLRKILFAASFFFLLILIFLSWQSWQLHQQMQTGFQKRSLIQSLEFFTAPERLYVGKKFALREYRSFFLRLGYKEKKPQESLLEKEFQILDLDRCQKLKNEISANSLLCLHIRQEQNKILVVLEDVEQILEIYSGEDFQTKSTEIELEAYRFAQFVGDKAILRETVEFGDIPANCMNAVLAIEDKDFLTHKGFSIKAYARAFLKNISSGRKAQGGSTITQQLVKNYFLTHKKTYTRKFKELIMSILLEIQWTKDEILHAYLNEIYMGQKDGFQVRGFGAASKYYFNKNIDMIGLPECALLASILNSPGRFNPFKKPEAALQRRQKTLDRMLEYNFIDKIEHANASKTPLPVDTNQEALPLAPYYLDAIRWQLSRLDLPKDRSYKIYSYMNFRSQEAAERAVQEHADRLQRKLRVETDQVLQAALIAGDPKRGQIQSIVSGIQHQRYPYQRALLSKRQVGSLMKSFVYLTALESLNEKGEFFTPLDILKDDISKIRYEGQVWEPKNYDKKFLGKIPMFYALKESRNVPTANLAWQIGLDSIVDMCKRLGIESELQALPSLSLGSFELSLFEVLSAYSVLSNFGKRVNYSFIERIEDDNQRLLFSHQANLREVVSEQKTAILTSMLQQTFVNGTAKYAKKLGYDRYAAGKTGTTNDYRDSWFAGYTANHVAVSWVGFDDNSSHGFSGASAALPIWVQYMKEYAKEFPQKDFPWPDSIKPFAFTAQEQIDLGVPIGDEEKKGIVLHLPKGTQIFQ